MRVNESMSSLVRGAVVAAIVCAGNFASAQPEPSSEGHPEASVDARGRVINSLGRPVRGAKIAIEGHTDAVTTNREGWFEITAPLGATLTIEANKYELGIATVSGQQLDDTVLLSEAQASET